MKQYIKLARPHHWMKNVLVVLPLLCSGQVGEWPRLRAAIWGFFAFSLMASGIYVVNDIRDREKDRNNSYKCHRPIASGAISIPRAVVFAVVLILISLSCGYLASGPDVKCLLFLGLYFVLNLGYSFGLKDVPLVDIAILVSGFLLRTLYGGAVTGIELSKWLCLTVTAGSFYLGLGKRKGELLGQKSQRTVLKYYSHDFLDKNMYVCLALMVMFYTLWTVDSVTVARVGSEDLIWTVPLLLLICMRYTMDSNREHDGDPVEVLIHDKVLLFMGLVLAIVVFFLIYI